MKCSNCGSRDLVCAFIDYIGDYHSLEQHPTNGEWFRYEESTVESPITEIPNSIHIQCRNCGILMKNKYK